MNKNEKQAKLRYRGLIYAIITTKTFYGNMVHVGISWSKITQDRCQYWICVKMVMKIRMPYIP